MGPAISCYRTYKDKQPHFHKTAVTFVFRPFQWQFSPILNIDIPIFSKVITLSEQ